MKIRIEIDENQDEEIVIRCKQMNERINNIQKVIKNEEDKNKKFCFYKDNVEYYLNLDSILFFETNETVVNAHTTNDVFETKYKLFELENILPNNFMRVSKSTILNINHIYSINRNITSSSMVEFINTHKKVYVSRLYYKLLKQKMEGRVLYER